MPSPINATPDQTEHRELGEHANLFIEKIMSCLPASHSSTTKAAAPTNPLNGYHPAIELPLHTNTLPRQFGHPSPAGEDILASGAAVPSGPVGPHTPPTLTARATASIEAQDHRLDVLESETFKNNLAHAYTRNPAVQKYLVDLYNEDHDVQQRGRQADHWVHKAAAQGHTGAQLFLAVLYVYGLGVQQSATDAFNWVQQAAEQGHADTQAQLGFQYSYGVGVKQDDDIAFKWNQKAAEQGHAFAQQALGRLYLNGRGVKKDDKQAAYWTLNSGLSPDGFTLSCARKFPVKLVKFLPQLFTETPEFQCVQTLDLPDNAIDDDAAVHLAQLITKNQTLEVLNLRCSSIGMNGEATLARALRSNLMLKKLYLDRLKRTNSARADIDRALVNNQNITVLMKEVEADRVAISDELPLDVLNLIVTATILADQKTADVNRTLAQTQAVLKELRLAVAQQFITG